MGRNTFFGAVANVVQIGTRLVTVPIVIAHLGLDGYGIWSIIMTVSAYMRFGSVGIKNAFQKYVAEATSTGQYKEASTLISTGSVGILIISLVGVVPIAVMSRPIAAAAGVPSTFLDQTGEAILLLSLILVLSNVGSAYEAIVMGAHRIDLARKLTSMFTVLEAIAIVIVLHAGAGLAAMAAIMATSELGYLACCRVVSKRLLPEVKVSPALVERRVVRELFRFAGSYQLVNILEVVYLAIVPLFVLRFFGAETTGVFAVANRLVTAALLLQDAFLIPLLSGGTFISAEGSATRMAVLVRKSFKTILCLAMLPLAFVAANGTTIISAWTGEANGFFGPAVWVLCLAGLFKAISSLGLVLYRASGKCLMDNVRQVGRIIVLVSLAYVGRSLGFMGLLWALCASELCGALFMMAVVSGVFKGVEVSRLAADCARVTLVAAVVIGIAYLLQATPVFAAGARSAAVGRLGLIATVTVLAISPALFLTGSLSLSEGRAVLSLFSSRKQVSA
jgi:O-antigen/teichoic acid export membrane protein